MVYIRYYNVFIALIFKNEEEKAKIDYLLNRMKTGERLHMQQLHRWCTVQQIEYHTRFYYRKDFPISANLWNLYSYIRFILERR